MAGLIAHTEYETINTPTRCEIRDITDLVERVRSNAGLWDGFVLVSTMHITSSIFVNDRESGLWQDIMTWLEELAPQKPEYRHHLTGEDNADAHLKRMLLGHQVIVPVTKGKLDLGRWERVHYGEFDGCRPKRILLKALGTTLSIVLAPLFFATGATSARAEDWPLFGHDPARTAVDIGGTAITPANVHRLRMRWQISLDTVADSTPIFLERVRAGARIRSMLFQTDKLGVTYGIDALTGRVRWRYRTHGPNITTSTPAADPSGSAVYVPGVDGMLHKLDASTGRELDAPGFPVRITRMPQTEKDASALNLANGYLYATTSGYLGDAPPYVGHVVSVHLSDGVTHVFNSLCSALTKLPGPNSCPASDSGIWSRGGAVVDPDPAMNATVYASTGNGDFDVGKGNYGDSVLGLSADASKLIGHYTPRDAAQLDSGDVDLGSTSPVLLPRQAGSRTPLMLAQGGKDAILRLVDRDPLPGIAHELQEISLPQALFSTPAVWIERHRTWIFMGFPQAVDAYVVVTKANGESRLRGVWRARPGGTSGEGTSPVVSNGMVFVAFDGRIVALNARTGRMLWSSSQRSALRTIGPVHWESPIVVDGAVYCSDENGHLTAYALPA